MLVSLKNAKNTWGEASLRYRNLRDMVEEEIRRLRNEGLDDELADVVKKLSLI